MKYLITFTLLLLLHAQIYAKSLDKLFPNLPDATYLQYKCFEHQYACPKEIVESRIRNQQKQIDYWKRERSESPNLNVNIRAIELVISDLKNSLEEHDLPAYTNEYWKSGQSVLYDSWSPRQPEIKLAMAFNGTRYITGYLWELAPELYAGEAKDRQFTSDITRDRTPFERRVPYLGFHQTGKVLFSQDAIFVNSKHTAKGTVDTYSYTPRKTDLKLSQPILISMCYNNRNRLVSLHQELEGKSQDFTFHEYINIGDETYIPRKIEQIVYVADLPVNNPKDYRINYELVDFKKVNTSPAIVGVDHPKIGTTIHDDRYTTEKGNAKGGITYSYQRLGNNLDDESRIIAKAQGALDITTVKSYTRTLIQFFLIIVSIICLVIIVRRIIIHRNKVNK